MATESGIILPTDSTGKAIRTETVTTTFTTGSGGLVHQQVVSVADPTTPANLLVVDSSGRITVNQAALTKGTQGTTGMSTQELKDAGRTPVVLSATAVASVTAAALLTLNIWKAGTVTSAASYTVTTGKTFRLQAVQFGTRFATPSGTVTWANVTFSLRAITSGALSATSALVYSDSKMAASNVATPNSDLSIEDGLEFGSGYVFGVSHIASAATLVNDCLLVGFEY